MVGRTRFCLHPHDRVSEIPIVGGTKNWNLQKLRDCDPDLLILDKEEHPREMAEESLPFWASHVRGVDCLPDELQSAKGWPSSVAPSPSWTVKSLAGSECARSALLNLNSRQA